MKKILVIEDDPVSRTVLVNSVESMGCIAVQSSSADRGLGVLSDNPDISLVITDLMLPGMSGQNLVRTMKSNHCWQNIPIIMVSGVVTLREISGILELGATRFLPKPVNIAELRHYITCCLNKDKTELPSPVKIQCQKSNAKIEGDSKSCSGGCHGR